MNLQITSTPITELEADAIVVGIFDNKDLHPSAAAVNAASGGQIARLIEAGEFSGKPYELLSIFAPPGIAARQVLLLGLGDQNKFDVGMAYRATAAAARALTSKARRTVAYFADTLSNPRFAENAVCGSMVGCQGQDLYRSERKCHPPETILWHGIDEASLATGRILGDSVNLTRRLINEPADEIYPESFAAE